MFLIDNKKLLRFAMCQFIRGVYHLMVKSINIFPREARGP